MPFRISIIITMFYGLEIKGLGRLLKNKQKLDEMQTGSWLTNREVHTCHATSVEFGTFHTSRDELLSSDSFLIAVQCDDRSTFILLDMYQIYWSL